MKKRTQESRKEMIKTITSQTDRNQQYTLTIDEEYLEAVGCTCPDRYYRRHTCKHMRGFDEQVAKDQTFAALMDKYDVRSQARKDVAYTRNAYYELATIGA